MALEAHDFVDLLKARTGEKSTVLHDTGAARKLAGADRRPGRR